MGTVLVIVESIGLIVGSLTIGILSCWLLWSAFKRVGHPEWGPPIVLAPAVFAMTGHLPASEFLTMTLIFAGLAVVPFCAEGLAWRARVRDRKLAGTAPVAYRRYPAIAGCICEARRPSPGELKKVAARMLSETFAAGEPMPGFAIRRAVLRAARAALVGND